MNALGWNVLSDVSRPREGEVTVNPEPMAELFGESDRGASHALSAPRISATALLRASYPQSPTEATGQGPGGTAEPQPYRAGRGYGHDVPGVGR